MSDHAATARRLRNARLPSLAVACALAHAPGAGAATPTTGFDDEVDGYRQACIVPFFEGKSEDASIAAIATSAQAEDMLSRLARSAPPNWQALSDRSVPVEQRLQGAVGLLGMAISHGSAYEKRVAAVYSALYFPVPRSEACQRPEGLREFLDAHDFWAAPAAGEP